MHENEAFQQRVWKRLRGKPVEPPKTQGDLERQIEAFNAEQLQHHTAIALSGAGKAHAHWVEQGDNGWGGAKRSVQEFSTKFAAFVQVYGGFIDVIRQANGPYGEVAYTTLSMLFTVSFHILVLFWQLLKLAGCRQQIRD